MKNRPLLTALLAVLLLPFLPFTTAAQPLPPPTEGAETAPLRIDTPVVHPLVWQTLAAAGQADVLVVMRVQADLTTVASAGSAALASRQARGRYVRDALWQVAHTTQRDLRAVLDARHIPYQSFYLVNALLIPAAGEPLVRALAARSDIARIEANPWLKSIPDEPAASPPPQQGGLRAMGSSIEPNLVRVHAPDVWALGYTGQGVVVAGNDTGIEWDHPALVGHYRAQLPGYGRHDFNWHDAIHSGGGACGPDSPEPCDDYGHGTHTLGTIVGDDLLGNQIGMAPGAQWIGCRNMNVGYGSPATYLECFEFFLAPYPVGGTPAQGDPALAPDIVNNSWSCPPDEGCAADTLDLAVQNLRRAGIAVVASAGNSGSACGSVATPPAVYPQSFTVGAFNHATGQIASFSARGPVTYRGQIYGKPDIAAPGVDIRSSVPGSGYQGGWQGTSMAAPHVSGALALLLSAAPAYAGQVAALQYALTATAEPQLDAQCGPAAPPNNVWGWGIVDPLAAVTLLTSGSLHGAVSDASTGAPLPGALVQADPLDAPPGPRAATGPDGSYALTLAAGTYSVTVSAAGYFSRTLPGVVVTSTTTLPTVALTPTGLPHASFQSNTPVCLGQPLLVTNTSTLAGAWAWTFGDGAASADWQPAHLYAAPGQYTVTLLITNPLGIDSAAAPAVVHPLPVPAFHWTAHQLTVTFANDSLSAASFLWSFGDGLTSTLPAPSHTYALSGTYTVTLTASDPCGPVSASAPVSVRAPRWTVYLPVDWTSGN